MIVVDYMLHNAVWEIKIIYFDNILFYLKYYIWIFYIIYGNYTNTWSKFYIKKINYLIYERKLYRCDIKNRLFQMFL
jgi:hypothetical protein